ncbi:MAG: DUF3854 domain-containing protein, partial [Deltaproteobacteria bacterium]|nr:DUF3854 domain-containing protein [Deltaproteobacteria bacterium]
MEIDMDIITVGQHGINGANLTPRHLAELRASGLSDATIAACGFFSLLTPDAIASKLKWSKPAVGLGDALAIPFVGADGKPTGYCRLKPDSPRKSKGKTVKYESPRGASNRAYFPPGTRAAIADATIPLIVTEGEKKSAAADQAGYPCIGLVGVYGWQRKRQRDANGNAVGERQLIDDLAGIPWQGRPVFVVFDSDAATNPNVQRAELALAEALRRHGADVRIVRLPADGDAKCGLDDYLVKCGPDAFRKLLDAATPPAKPLTVIEAADDPHRLARLYLCESCTHHDGVTLRYWRDEWHQWDGASWRTKTGAELGAELADSAKREMDRVNLAA